MWNDILQMGISAPEKIVRTAAVYLALVVLLRVIGRRELAQLNALDLVVMLLLSNVVQNAIIGPDNSVSGGILGAATLLAINSVLLRLARRSHRFARLIEGKSRVLAEHGHWDDDALRRTGVRKADAEAAVRRQNAVSIHAVERVSLEPGGAILTYLKDTAQPVTQGDLKRLEDKLDALIAGSASGHQA